MCLESFDKDIDNVAYKTYDTMLSTFNKWKGRLKPEILAGAGFYSILFSDVCKCYYCGVEIYDWLYDDCPVEEHYKFAPTSSFRTSYILPGYNYSGPGTKSEKRIARGDVGINSLDAACKEHDIAYSQSEDLSKRHASDKLLEDQD
ncbi:death-associated inhibitor of apoptosis 1-like [Sitophilus oryzae]|uniref:Death-associated inhibitor of apoptosis 1-like n=1 Tax=Sitophilus oryzae TaxID=7048 RepID=A0A6J2XGT8_SITOR|nr:death-associated inhibitor of apoptosis 1-like [Sitophilus oryzae]